MQAHDKARKGIITKEAIQDDYSKAVSEYAELILKDDRWLLHLLKRDKKDSCLRKLEKDNRHSAMSSAFGQSAFDYAFDRLATRAGEIKAYAYGQIPSIFTSSKILFADCVTLMENGWLKVTVAFEKKHRSQEVKKYNGVDIGTKDMFYPSEGEPHGTFDECFKYYKDELEPALAEVSTIRNAKRAILHYLRRHRKTLPEEVVKSLRDKADRLEKMLRMEQKSVHKQNTYHAMQEKEIKDSVQDYISSLDGDKSVCTVLELLDTREFNKSKKVNSMLSTFARGRAAQKLMDTLNWMGYPYMQVEPAYTSQCCPVCSYTDQSNRNGKKFKCKCCGYTDDADHVGSDNITSRATDTGIQALCETFTGQKRRDEIKKLLLDRNSKWRKSNEKTEAAPVA